MTRSPFSSGLALVPAATLGFVGSMLGLVLSGLALSIALKK